VSYFIPIARTARVLQGDLASIAWPSDAIVYADLEPPDLFGEAADANPREVVLQSAAGVKAFWDNNTGRTHVESDVHMKPAASILRALSDVQLAVYGTRLSATFRANDMGEVMDVAHWIEFYYCPFLSLSTGVYVVPRRLHGQIGNGCAINFEFVKLSTQLKVFRDDVRDRALELARDFADMQDARVPRLVLASLYFRQACRLQSSRQVLVPALGISEAVINLAKALNVLFGDSNDEIREGMKLLGFSHEEVESQIVPIMLIRSSMDVAHAVNRRLNTAQVDTLFEYCQRATRNVRAVILKAALSIRDGSYTPKPVDTEAAIIRTRRSY
jgi:hypothetical protein